jgi:hypothetical protein
LGEEHIPLDSQEASMRAFPARVPRTLLAAGAPVGILLSGLLVWQASLAVVGASVTNPGNRWEVGMVSLTDNAPEATALFDASELQPGSSGSACITVTYGGNLDASVRLYVAPGDLAGDLGDGLALTIHQGTKANPSSWGDCDGFVAEATLHSGTVSGFAAAHSGFGSGAGSWQPSAAGQQRTYRFAYELTEAAAPAGQADVLFTWEARSD